MVLESSGSNNHPLRFLSYLGGVGGWAREAGGGGGGDGGDQTSVGDEGWVRSGAEAGGGASCRFGGGVPGGRE